MKKISEYKKRIVNDWYGGLVPKTKSIYDTHVEKIKITTYYLFWFIPVCIKIEVIDSNI